MNKLQLAVGRYCLPIAAVFCTVSLALGQLAPELKQKGKGGSAEVVTLKLDSKLMGREMPYRVIIPADYKTRSDARYGVLYLLHGLTGHFDNWTDKTRVADYALKHRFIIVTPEGNNGWYTDSATVPNDKYESYLIKELIPEIEKRYRTISNRDNRYVAGLSMGGYGAVKLGLKYPAMFSVVGSFSGAFGATGYTGPDGGVIGKSLAAVFGPADSETRKANDVFHIVKQLTPEQMKSLPFIYQSCGTEDFVFGNNRDFVALLTEKKVPHEYRQHPGGHTWGFWDEHVREFLDVVTRRLKK
jgi:putative tributyrin esterase